MFIINRVLFLSTIILSTQVYAKIPNAWLKTPDVLTVCSYSKFEPISYDHGKGFEADLLRAIAKSWGIKIRFFSEDVYEGIWRFPSRAYTLCDISIGGISATNARKKQHASFSIPTAHFKQSLLVRAKDFYANSLRHYSDFKYNHRKIGVVPGTTGQEFAYQRAGDIGIDSSVFVEYANEIQLLQALKQGKIDAIARGEIGNEYQASIDKNVKVIDKKDFGEGFSFVVSPNKPELLQAINSSIKSITKDGKIGFSTWLKNHDVFIGKGL